MLMDSNVTCLGSEPCVVSPYRVLARQRVSDSTRKIATIMCLQLNERRSPIRSSLEAKYARCHVCESTTLSSPSHLILHKPTNLSHPDGGPAQSHNDEPKRTSRDGSANMDESRSEYNTAVRRCTALVWSHRGGGAAPFPLPTSAAAHHLPRRSCE